jgi:hypothetical protein
MNSVKVRITIFILTVGLMTACGSQPAETFAPASQPTEEVVPIISTEAPTNTPVIPTDTAAPTDTAQSAPPAAVSFANDVLPILQSRCVNCHGGDRIEEGLLLRSYAELMAGSDNGPVITPGNVENSLLAELILSRKMPKRGPKLTPPQVQIIVDWITQGALEN